MPDAFFRIPDLLDQYLRPRRRHRRRANMVRRVPARPARTTEERSSAGSRPRARGPGAGRGLRRRFFGDVDPALLDTALGELAAQARYIEQSIRRYSTTGAALEYHCRSEFGGMKRQISFMDCEHHASHAWYACLASPFAARLCAVIDGEGEGRASSFYRYENGRVTELPVKRSKYETSLGALYTFITDLCGFDSWRGEEWKLMGLASYGTPRADYEADAARIDCR